MTRGVRQALIGSFVLAALLAVAGCGHYFVAEREPWRHEAEAACLSSGAVKESPARVRITAINGPGMCGMDYPLKVSALGDSAPLGYDEEPVRPPNPIAGQFPAIQSSPLPPPQAYPAQNGAPAYPAPYGAAQPPPAPYGAAPPLGAAQYPPPQYGSPYGASPYGAAPYGSAPYGSAQTAPQGGPPVSLVPPGAGSPEEDDVDIPDGPQRPYYGGPNAAPVITPGPQRPSGPWQPRAPQHAGPLPPAPYPPRLNSDGGIAVASAGPVEVKPAATLACPIVSALDQWISGAVQPAALRWFRQPVVEIKQISAYSCRGMNGNPNAHISEHAFGNALDIAEFLLADGHKVSVQYGWHGTPEEQGFLHDVQAAACQQFTTVLAPGANVYHYNHIHVDLMRHAGHRQICQPAAIPGDVVAARARARYAAQHGNPQFTGTIKSRSISAPLGYSGDDERLPPAVPGED